MTRKTIVDFRRKHGKKVGAVAGVGLLTGGLGLFFRYGWPIIATLWAATGTLKANTDDIAEIKPQLTELREDVGELQVFKGETSVHIQYTAEALERIEKKLAE